MGRGTRTRGRSAAAAVGATALCLGLAAGCSSSPSGTTNTTAAPVTVNAPHDVKLLSCKEGAASTWLMVGQVHNSSSTKRRYTVVIDFETQPGHKVVTSRTIDTSKIVPGMTINFGASGATGESDVSCVVAKVTATT